MKQETDGANLLRGGPTTSSTPSRCCTPCSSKNGQKGNRFVNFSVFLLLAALLGGGIGYFIKNKPKIFNNNATATFEFPDLLPFPPQPSKTILGNFSKAAVSIDGEPCAQKGVSVLKRNGTAADAAIAALLCNGLINAHSMGVGGGFLMTVYDAGTGDAYAVNAREAAPLAASVDMYEKNANESSRGARSIAVPGEIAGYWQAKQRFGNPDVSWESLFQPAIQMCREGIPVTHSHAQILKEMDSYIRADPGMREVFLNPKTNQTWLEGEKYKREVFADTLEKIAKNGPDEFYKGETAKLLIKDIQAAGGMIVKEDLENYSAPVTPAITVDIGGHLLHSSPPPGSGAILAAILNIMELYEITPGDDRDPLMFHRLVEAFKWAYAGRTLMGDPADAEIKKQVEELVGKMTSEDWARDAFSKISDETTYNSSKFYGGDFVFPADHGTAHVSVLGPNGDAVSATSTVNLYFGSCFISPSTGILLNDEMDDFSFPGQINHFGLPPSKTNFPKPGKRPMSSMCPSIVTNKKGEVQLMVGAAGGTKITTAVAQTTLRNLWLKEDIKTSVDARRIHHQLEPMHVEYENGTVEDIALFLHSRGHGLEEIEGVGSVVCAVAKDSTGAVTANADWRKSGGVDGF